MVFTLKYINISYLELPLAESTKSKNRFYNIIRQLLSYELKFWLTNYVIVL